MELLWSFEFCMFGFALALNAECREPKRVMSLYYFALCQLCQDSAFGGMVTVLCQVPELKQLVSGFVPVEV
jgi:hypothetical protein